MGQIEDLAARYGVGGASPSPAANEPDQSTLESLAARYGIKPATPPEPSLLDKYVVQPFKDIGKSLLSATDYANHAILHPQDTATTLARNPGAALRETIRAATDNIPFGHRFNKAVTGVDSEYSAEDAAAQPGLRNFAGIAVAPGVGKMVGGIAAKGLEALAPVVGKTVSRIGEAAKERKIDRAIEDLQVGANKRARAGLRTDVVAETVADSPELQAAAGNDAKTAKVLSNIREKAGAELDRQYGGYNVTLGDSIDNFNRRIKTLRTAGTSTDAAVADALEKTRDELTSRLGQRSHVTVKQLRAEQTDFQGKGYGKALPGDEAASARIEAAREASKAVGDAVVKRVTGVPYNAAKALAEADPNGIAGRLFKANDQINAAYKIEKGMTDRAARVQPREGVIGKLHEIGKAVRHPVGLGLSLAPRAAAAGLTAVDNGLARLAPTAPAATGRRIATTASAFSDQIKHGVAGLSGLNGMREATASAPAGGTLGLRQALGLGPEDDDQTLAQGY